MAQRILITGIPSQHIRLIQRAHGSQVVYTEAQPQPRSSEAFLKEMRDISNTGNYLIGEGALQALAPNATHIPFWHLYNCCQNGTGLQEIAKDFDICVFTCANLLRAGLSADAEAQVLSNLDLPVVMLGIGIQSNANLKKSLPAGTLELLRVLKNKEHHFLTRGRETALFLKEEGFSNVQPIGCPSTYFNSDNFRLALSRLKSVDVGSAKTVFSGYLGSDRGSIDDMNALTRPDSTAVYVIQDEHLHFDMKTEPDARGHVYDPASGRIIGESRFKDEDILQRDVALHAYFDPVQWRAWTSQMEFSFGRRFHGNIIALQAGVPGLMVAVDDRMREMLDFVGLPYIEAEKLAAASDRVACVAEHIAGLNSDEIIARYNERERGFRLALSDIGLIPAQGSTDKAA